jgi:hypothetical protein
LGSRHALDPHARTGGRKSVDVGADRPTPRGIGAALGATDDPFAKASLASRILTGEARRAHLLGLDMPARMIVDANDMSAADREAERAAVEKLKELSIDELRTALALPPDRSKLN